MMTQAEITAVHAAIDVLDDKVIEIHRMLSEIHAVLAPLLPMVQGMAETPGNPMLALMGGMRL